MPGKLYIFVKHKLVSLFAAQVLQYRFVCISSRSLWEANYFS